MQIAQIVQLCNGSINNIFFRFQPLRCHLNAPFKYALALVYKNMALTIRSEHNVMFKVVKNTANRFAIKRQKRFLFLPFIYFSLTFFYFDLDNFLAVIGVIEYFQ